MSELVRDQELQRAIKYLGFDILGLDGRGHVRLRHGNGQEYSIPSSASDWRSRKNTLADLERIAGQKMPRQRAGKYHHQRVTQANFRQSTAEVAASAEIEKLMAQADSITRQLCALATTLNRDAAKKARKLVDCHEQIRTRLAGIYHHPIPALSLDTIIGREIE